MKHDKDLLRRRFARNLDTYNTLAEVQRAVAGRLAEAIAEYPISATAGIEIGAGTGFLTRHLVRLFPEAAWTVNDLVPQSREFLPVLRPEIDFVAGDGESLARTFVAESFDLVASASTVQWFDDLPGFIALATAALKRGGLFAISTFGPENFREITATTGQGLLYSTLDELRGMFTRGGLEVLRAQEWTQQQYYVSPLEVLRHLRLTGVNAVEAQRWTHSRLKRFEEDYRDRYMVDVTVPAGGADDGTGIPAGASSDEAIFSRTENAGDCVTLTFHPILLVGRKC